MSKYSADLVKFAKGQLEQLVGMADGETINQILDKEPEEALEFLVMFGWDQSD